ncbi:MAG: hypothetical protein WEE89_16500 [Gemmatimonadota bacterium]
MRRLHMGDNFVVFLVFFGIALLESTQEGHWPSVLFWLGVGVFFLAADNLKPRRH